MGRLPGRRVISGFAITGGLLGLAALWTIASRQASAESDTVDGIRATTDPAVVARGRYLAHGPAHCSACHSNIAGKANDVAADLPLDGGAEFPIALGVWTSPNLTADPQTGLGRYSDGQIVRAIRYGVGADGRTLLPFMQLRNMSDEDLTAVLSYLRTLPPSKAARPGARLTALGWFVMNFAMKPAVPDAVPAKTAPKGPSVELGSYLANNVASCAFCHTKFDQSSGKALGAAFAGGAEFEAIGRPGWVLTTPNLTPAPKTGRIAAWSEETFLARFKSGAHMPETHMAWATFAKMSDDDIRSIYRYLRTLPPVENDTGPSLHEVRDRG
jgi:mono/diheme cytochrome c family protein